MQRGRAAHNCQPQKRPNSRSAPRIVVDVVTRLEIRLAPTFGAGRFRQVRNIRKS